MRTAAQLAAVRNAYELLTNGAMGSVKEIGPYRGCIGIEASLAAILVFAERLRFDAAPSRERTVLAMHKLSGNLNPADQSNDSLAGIVAGCSCHRGNVIGRGRKYYLPRPFEMSFAASALSPVHGQPSLDETAREEAGQIPANEWRADSVRRKRKRKMNKHKLRKRRRLTRHSR